MIDAGWLIWLFLTDILGAFLGGISEGYWLSGQSSTLPNLARWSAWLPDVGGWISSIVGYVITLGGNEISIPWPDGLVLIGRFFSFDFSLFYGSPYLVLLRWVFILIGIAIIIDAIYRALTVRRG